ncbi:MBL fold metallo-hydrolase [Amycolatopsis sp. GM8]|uniref:MBL fold metallo-hydrolase n=1 Tax=Amycolatopsis sp. GM8 TaxID=2896530 RepID=UPI001F3436C5|nr:MBL fold metallo-hydrolase [Amycolatopsis sp. GM8]
MTALTWTTLGTAAGPNAHGTRAQPANLLHRPGWAVLVDAGDSAVDQIARAGARLADVRAVVLSHLHIDHTGGLFALLGRRLQPRVGGPLTIYGPPGTAELVGHLTAALRYLADLGHATNPRVSPIPAVTAVEVTEGDEFDLDEIHVRAAVNTHYSFPPDSDDNARFQSLSFRFGTPGRAIVYTGDTGPSLNVAQLAQDADLLISEINDPNRVPPALRDKGPAVAEFVKQHFEREHLSPSEAGTLAARAGVRAIVLTHVGVDDADLAAARQLVASHFDGDIHFARDLDRF